MSKIKGLTIRFSPSPSPDVVSNKLYIQESPAPVTYESPSYNVGNVVGADKMISVDLKALLPNVDGIYNIGIVSVDDAGNESDMKTAKDVPLDFLAPNPPGNIETLI